MSLPEISSDDAIAIIKVVLAFVPNVVKKFYKKAKENPKNFFERLKLKFSRKPKLSFVEEYWAAKMDFEYQVISLNAMLSKIPLTTDASKIFGGNNEDAKNFLKYFSNGGLGAQMDISKDGKFWEFYNELSSHGKDCFDKYIKQLNKGGKK